MDKTNSKIGDVGKQTKIKEAGGICIIIAGTDKNIDIWQPLKHN